MKKISNILLSISILLITLMLFVVEYNKNDEIYQDSTKTFKTNNALAIMLDDGNGNYNPSDSNAFPTSGYIFNTELSKCENGGEVTWDDTNKKVIVSSNVSDKCYIYFDKEPSFADKIVELYTTQGANNLYHHNGTILATEVNADLGIAVGDVLDANDGSYRYAGSYDTTQNWVCFGMDDATGAYANGWCDVEHLYRIIGVFDSVIIGEDGTPIGETEQRVKLVKASEGTENSLGTMQHGSTTPNAIYYKGKLTTIPTYYWSGSSDKRSNIWSNSTLNTDILNGTYLTTLSESWSSKIAVSEWKIGGNTGEKIKNAPSVTYQNEVISPVLDNNGNNSYNAKIGLMYVNDYGFAASPANWKTLLGYGGYSENTNTKNNWMHLGIQEWTITRVSDNAYSGIDVMPIGSVNAHGVVSSFAIRPAFYLNSNVTFAGGTGTETDPYRIA